MTALHTVTEKFPARTHASKLIKELVALLPEAERVGVSLSRVESSGGSLPPATMG
jgi:hypothetical protein